jgi:hypothetical protein
LKIRHYLEDLAVDRRMDVREIEDEVVDWIPLADDGTNGGLS